MLFNMRGKKFHVGIQIAIFLFVIILFSYFRLKPIYFQTVGYTYDQGRDFLKAAEIVLYKNPTFIGPTTGIMGIYHGAWWYYLLSVGFFIFNGLPIGFYYLNFFIQLSVLIAVLIFAAKRFDSLTQIILGLIIATAPYLIFTNILLANNVMAMPPFLFLLITTILLLEKKFTAKVMRKTVNLPLFFLAGLFLGFTAEFEFAFGLLLIPVYILSVFVFNFLTQSFTKARHYLYFALGLGMVFLPRLLFEIKNNFGQLRTMIGFITNPQYHTPKPFKDIFDHRIMLFDGYYGGIFINDIVKIFVSLTIVIFLWIVVKKRKKISIPFAYLITLGVLLFLISLIYKDTFWPYYYDGIQYLFILVIGYVLAAETSSLKIVQNILKYIVIGLLLIFTLLKLKLDFASPKVFDGIQVQQEIVKYIHDHEPNKTTYCVRVYTPPVIPYTYDYLFLYSEIKDGIKTPSREWQNKQCWFILESDDYKERKQKWIDENIPKNGIKVSGKTIKDVEIQLWQGN